VNRDDGWVEGVGGVDGGEGAGVGCFVGHFR
jgi:hypothetical protein